MPKYIQIQIPEPCHEEWHNMSPVPNGRFCDSCQKKVVDFTLMTDSQLLEFFKKNPPGGCGRFYTDQLDNPILIPVKKIPWVKYFFQITIPALLFSFRVSAQKLLHKSQVEVVSPAKQFFQKKEMDSFIKVTGKVTSSDGRGIGFATVMVYGSHRGVATDSAGNFSITLNRSNRFLEISCVGFEKSIITIDPSISTLDIVLKENIQLRTITMGGISRGVYVKSSKQRKNKTVTKTRNLNNVAINTITVFPNPVQTFSSLTIRWKNPVKTNQELAIYDITGMLVQKEVLHINDITHEVIMKIKLTHAGNYILHITDAKTRKVLITQIMVE